MKKFYPVALILFINIVYTYIPVLAESNPEFVLISDVKWEPLNPARGDASPMAGTLWGDRNGSVPTGFLVKFLDGFTSPPHIHNVAYRGVVISGHIHNDDPHAEKMWMPSGSFWTQPAGETHITAAKGSYNLAYIEIDSGPYLVHPTEKEFDSGERPINVDVSNLVWINLSRDTSDANTTEISFLWGNPRNDQLYGSLIKFPAELATKLEHHGSIFHAVVIKGQLQYHINKKEIKSLEPGSYFTSNEKSVHKISIKKDSDTIIYVRTNGTLNLLD